MHCKSRGWTISAIARHLGRDRKTVRAYINGERVPGVRARSAPDPLEPFTKYLAARFVDDPHVWASALYDEVVRLGYPLSYPSFVRQVRAGRAPSALRGLLAGVEGPRHHRDRPPAGRRDPVGLVRAPERSVGSDGLRVVGHAAALGQGARRAGREDGPGPPDRGHGRGAAATRRDGAGVADRPPGDGDRAGDQRRPGVLRSGGQALRGRRRALSAPARQSKGSGRVLRALRLGSLVAHHGRHEPRGGPALPRRLLRHHRRRARTPRTGRRAHARVGELADAEPLLALPPARSRPRTEVPRVVADNATSPSGATATRCRPDSAGTTLLVRHRLGAPTIDVVAPSGAILVTHRLAPAGSGALVRSCRAQRGPRGRRALGLHHGPAVRQEGEPPPGQRGTRRGGPPPRAHRA